MVVFCHYMVGGRWFMNMFWGVNMIFKGNEVDDIFGWVSKPRFLQA